MWVFFNIFWILIPCQTYSLGVFPSGSFCWWSPLLCRSFLVWCSPTCLFLFLLPELLVFMFRQSQIWFPEVACRNRTLGAGRWTLLQCAFMPSLVKFNIFTTHANRKSTKQLNQLHTYGILIQFYLPNDVGNTLNGASKSFCKSIITKPFLSFLSTYNFMIG